MPAAPERPSSKKKASENSLLALMNQRGPAPAMTSMNSQSWKSKKQKETMLSTMDKSQRDPAQLDTLRTVTE